MVIVYRHKITAIIKIKAGYTRLYFNYYWDCIIPQLQFYVFLLPS